MANNEDAAMKAASQAATTYMSGSEEMGVDTTAFDIPYGQTYAGDIQGEEAQKRQAAQAQAAQVGQTQLGEAATLSPEQKQWREQQMALANQLRASAAGQGPSAAQSQMQRGMDQAIRAQRAMAAGGPARNRAFAQRQAAGNIANIQQDIAGQAAALSAQEQQAAIGQLGGVLSGARGQDIGVAGQEAQFEQQRMMGQGAMDQASMMQQAQFEQQTALANQQAAMQQAAMNDQMTQYYMSQGFTRDQAQAQANMAMEQLKAQNYQATLGASQQAAATPSFGEQVAMQAIGGVAQGAGQGLTAMASDKRLKKDIKEAGKDIDEMLNAISASSWKYDKKKTKDLPDHVCAPEGVNVGVMAQDLEKSKVGKKMVHETGEGMKTIQDYNNVGIMLAAMARLNERLNKVEKK